MKIVWRNSGGEIDSVIASDPVAAVQELIDMVETAGELHEGDTITVVEDAYSDVGILDRRDDDLRKLVDRVHVNDPTAIERYKGFVIRLLPSTRYTWVPPFNRGPGVPTTFTTVEEARADIDLFVARVDTAGASR